MDVSKTQTMQFSSIIFCLDYEVAELLIQVNIFFKMIFQFKHDDLIDSMVLKSMLVIYGNIHLFMKLLQNHV